MRERILRGGYSVFPQEVAAVLLTHPAVAEAAVIGVPRAELGEEVVAFVALRPGARVGSQELVTHCKERLAALKDPRQVTILDALPRSSTGRVLKSRLRERPETSGGWFRSSSTLRPSVVFGPPRIRRRCPELPNASPPSAASRYPIG